ncbi:L-ectoine synthase OS=Streptomyces fumanus OX=67302 GN=ectC PE=3 SV=1 [Streptomyces fumanus]
MIVRSFKEIEGTDRHVRSASGTWESKRIVLAKEKVGFSVHETILYAGTSTDMWYANHIEAVVCTKGDAELTDRETGKTYRITPGTMYLLDGHERHTLKVNEDFHCICVLHSSLDRTGGPRRERRLPAAHRTRGGVSPP